MPPGQPVHRCAGCGLLHPCRAFDGDWLCVDCAPVDVEPVVMTDGGERVDGEVVHDDEPSGTLVLADEAGRSLTWHHSVEFDGFVHKTACGRVIDCSDIRDVLMDPVDSWRKNVTPSNGCTTCHDSVYQRREFNAK